MSIPTGTLLGNGNEKADTVKAPAFLDVSVISVLLSFLVHQGKILEAAVEDGLLNGLSGCVELGMGLAVLSGITHNQQRDDLQILGDGETFPQQRLLVNAHDQTAQP